MPILISSKKATLYRHPSRYQQKRTMVLVSNCGFPEASHFDGLKHVFKLAAKQGGAPLVGRILAPAGELLKEEAFRPKFKPILEAVYRAGVELVRNGRVSEETEAIIQTPIIPVDAMASMANISWDNLIEAKGSALNPGKINDMRLLLWGMAATFNSEAAGDLEAVIQFHVMGTQPGNWYLSLKKGACTMAEGESDAPTLRSRRPRKVWLAVANKEMDAQKAFMEGKYTVQGDMALLMRMTGLFGA